MKCKRILCALLAAALLSASVPMTALAVESTPTAENQPQVAGASKEASNAEEANISGNLVNGGMATTYDDVVYYVNPDDGGCLYANQGGRIVKLTDFGVQYLNVSGDGALYYTVVDGAEGLTKIGRYTLSTGEQDTLFAIDLYKGIKNLIVQDGICYFISDGVVQSLEIATGARETLLGGLSDVTAFLLFDGGYAYSRATADGQTPVMVYHYDTMEETTVTQTASGFDVSGDYVYYANSSDEYRLYRVKLDGSSDERLSDVPVCNIVAMEDGIYYKNRTADSEVLVYSLTAETETVEGSGACTEFTVLPNEEVVTNNGAVADLTEVASLEDAANGRAAPVATSEYKTWKQYDSRWGNELVGNGGTMKQIGCLVTSLAICIVDAEVRSEDEFNPGIFVRALNNNGGFESGGNLRWYSVSQIVPEFQVNVWNQKLSGLSQEEKTEIIQSHLDAGRQVVVSVNNGGHWVAVDDVDGGNVSIFDPGYNKSSLYRDYDHKSLYQLAAYDVSKTSNGEELVKYTVTASSLNYRDKPSTSGNSKGTLKQGTTVNVVAGYSASADGYTWYKIKKGTQYFYVAAEYLEKVQVEPTSIKLSETTSSVAVGGSFTLNATISPSSSNKTITWSSSNKAVATVSTVGVVKGIQEGTATITAKTVNGKTATCKVTVTEKEILIDYITTVKLNYRASPNGEWKGELEKGTTVHVVDGSSETANGLEWYKIKIGSSYYYVAAMYLKKPDKTPTLAKVTGLKAVAKTETTLKLQFNAVSNATGYKIYDAETGKAVVSVTTQNGVSVLTKTITGLVAGKTYQYKVRAYATVNGTTTYGAYSDVCKATTTAPTLGQVTGLKAIKKTETTLKLQFNAVKGAGGYEIYDAETGKILASATTQNGVSVLTKTITGLNPGEMRKYKVRAYAKVNGTTIYGAYSDVYEKATAAPTLAKVTGLKAIKKTQTTLKLQFNAVKGAGGYEIYDADTGKVLASATTQNGVSVLTKTITGLNPGETRKYKVRAYVKVNGTTFYGAYSNVYEKATATPTLAKVTGLKAIKKTQTTLKLQFNAVKGAGGYEIYDAASGKLLAKSSTQNGVAVLTKTITGLNPGEIRKYKVRAYAVVNGATSYGFFSDIYEKATAATVTETLVKYKTTVGDLNYRATPSSSGTVKGKLKKGEVVNVVSGYSKTANNIKWFKVKISGKYYYIASNYLKKV